MLIPATATRVDPRAAGHGVGPRVEVVTGPCELLAVLAEVDELATRCDAPITARGPWLRATLESLGDAHPWGVLAYDAYRRLVGAVLLVDQIAELAEVTSLLGTDAGHRGAILTQQPAVATALGRAVAEAIGTRRRWPCLSLGPLPATDVTVAAFVASFDGFALEPMAPIPGIRRTGDGDAASYLANGMQRTLRKARNRMLTDGRRGRIATTADATVILEALPTLEQLHRERDHAQGRRAYLDDEISSRRWRGRLRTLAQTGRLELATLLIDDELAAFVLGSHDGASYQLLEGRFVSAWARYSPGRMLESAVVQRWLDDDTVCSFDWMTAAAPETLLATNVADPVVRVCLVSHGGR